jgi:Phage-related minor tail protein
MNDTLNTSIVIRTVNRASAGLRQIAEDLKLVRKQSADMRETAGSMAAIGAGMTGFGLAGAYGLKEMIEPAMQVEDALHRIANSLPAHTNHVRDLAAAQAAAEATSNALGISQEGLLKQIYLGTSAGLNMAESIKSMRVASQLAVAANGDLESVQRTLNLAYVNFKDPSLNAAQNIQRIGDAMLTASEKFDYKDINEVREQLELAMPTAIQFGTSLKDTLAILGDFTRHGLTGSVAGAAFEESAHGVLEMQQKLGIAMVRNARGGVDYARSIAAVRQHFIDLYGSMEAIPPQVQEQIGKVFGIRGKRVLLIDPSEFASFRATLEKGLLTTQAGAAERMSEAVNQVRRLHEAFTNMAVDIGTTVLPSVVRVAQAIVPIVHEVAAFAKRHQELTKLAVEFAALASAALLVGGAIALAGSAAGGFLVALKMIRVFTSGVSLASTAVGGLTNPIGLVLIGVAALAAAAYELYEHWAGVKTFFSSIWAGIQTGAAAIGSFFKQWGLEILGFILAPWAMLPYEIYKHWGKIKDAATSIAHGIARLFVGHSPIPEGPLHDLNLSRQVAISLRPGPVVSAARRLAAAAALTIPVALAGPPAFAAPRLATVAPALAAASAPALEMRAPRRAGSAPISLHLEPHFDFRGAGAELDLEQVRAAVREEMTKSGYELAQVLKREQQRTDRLEF